MKIKYCANKHERINRGFIGITTFERSFWFNENTKQWETNPSPGEFGISTHQTCKSVRAFRRRLKSLPSGVKFILVSPYYGYDVWGYGNKK